MTGFFGVYYLETSKKLLLSFPPALPAFSEVNREAGMLQNVRKRNFASKTQRLKVKNYKKQLLRAFARLAKRESWRQIKYFCFRKVCS